MRGLIGVGFDGARRSVQGCYTEGLVHGELVLGCRWGDGMISQQRILAGTVVAGDCCKAPETACAAEMVAAGALKSPSQIVESTLANEASRDPFGPRPESEIRTPGDTPLCSLQFMPPTPGPRPDSDT